MEFKLGDRVAAYEKETRAVGTVEKIYEDGILGIVGDDKSRCYAHAKQCRRIKPKKKPREFELSKNDQGLLGVIEFNQYLKRGERIWVREVFKK